MNREDLFIDFLPEEYRPKPEWRSFPLVAAAVLLTVGLGVFLNFTQLENRKKDLANTLQTKQTELDLKQKRAVQFLPLQGKARVVNGYLRSILQLRLANPPWWAVYNRVEEMLPEGVWLQNMRFTGAKKGWPGVSITVVAAGTSYAPLYTLHSNLINAQEFVNIRTNGYTKSQLQGQWVLTSNYTFSVEKWYFIEVPQLESN
ncbi:MAG: hypothetical protein GEEBNDBF_01345 [bacterium]|nr:hypothetical protein [bacterium]